MFPRFQADTSYRRLPGTGVVRVTSQGIFFVLHRVAGSDSPGASAIIGFAGKVASRRGAQPLSFKAYASFVLRAATRRGKKLGALLRMTEGAMAIIHMYDRSGCAETTLDSPAILTK
jgi:hypothetical protein